jgi:dihydroorotate dehydrogenase
MISVTAAAHGFRRTSRSMGTHLKAFGSGRVAVGSIEEEESETPEQNRYFTHKQFSEPENKLFLSSM